MKQAFLKAHLVTQELWNPQEYLQTRRQGLQTGEAPRGQVGSGDTYTVTFWGLGPKCSKTPSPTAPRPPGHREGKADVSWLHSGIILQLQHQAKCGHFLRHLAAARPGGKMRVFMHNQCSDRMLQLLEEHLTCGQTRTHAELCLYHRSEYKYCYKHHNL